MRILYGINGEGNGHTSRAQAIVPKLIEAGAEVDYLYSGRDPDKVPAIDGAKSVGTRRGLNFVTYHGRISMLRTVFNALLRIPQLVVDITKLDLSSYDLVITDYEPVTAWAARTRKFPSLGIAHQYAFKQKVPGSSMSTTHIPTVAPVRNTLGLHFHHFGKPGIIPPIVEGLAEKPVRKGKILVYLPHEELEDVKKFLDGFPGYQFHVYSPEIKEPQEYKNILLKPVSRTGFREDFADCEGIITNGGFMSISEALHLGKKLLVRPLSGQTEQHANVRALAAFSNAVSTPKLDRSVLLHWLENKQPATRITYPDVAQGVAQWIMAGDWSNPQALADSLWTQAKLPSPQ